MIALPRDVHYVPRAQRVLSIMPPIRTIIAGRPRQGSRGCNATQSENSQFQLHALHFMKLERNALTLNATASLRPPFALYGKIPALRFDVHSWVGKMKKKDK